MKCQASIKHLAGVQNALGVESGPEFAHDSHLRLAGEFREELFLGKADAVFAGDGTAEADGLVKYLLKRLVLSLDFICVAFVCEKSRVQITVAHVTEGTDF